MSIKPKRKSKDVLYNADPDTSVNLQFQRKVANEYRPPKDKPIVFLPCSKTKTAGYSKSQSHCYMSAVTKNPAYEKIVLSDALVVVPYKYEKEIPVYNCPPKLISAEHKQKIIDRTASSLITYKKDDPTRQEIYFIGGKSHYEILSAANKKAGNPFQIVGKVGSIQNYAKYATELNTTLQAQLPKKRSLLDFFR